MLTLIKLSVPGWEKNYTNEAELKAELYSYICNDCREGDSVTENSDIDHMLWCACGCEFMVENDEQS